MLPVCGHEFVRALVESDGEEQQGVDGIAKDGGGSGGNPPARVLAQAIKDADVEELADGVGDKACNRDAGDEDIKGLQGGKTGELAFHEQDGDEVGQDKRRNHDAEDDFARHFCAEDAHGEVRGEEDEGEGECAPGGVQVSDFERDLHENVARGDDEDMPEGEPVQGFLTLCGGEGECGVGVVHDG